ncbi:MAG: hypothetical protein OEX07_15175, partial [Gammaproteobacteria bacterium]|nr:hypothetical protein [Gammaproteobacteria bacterium]
KDTSVKLNPRYTADGNNIIFSADYGGIFNIQKLELETGKISTLSNIKGAALQASPSMYDDSIYYANLGANGSDLYKLTPETQKEFITPDSPHKIKPAAQALTISLEKMEITDYSPFSGLKPRWWSPVLETSSDRKEIGFSTSSADPLLRHTYNLSFAYDSENQLPLGEISYVYDRFQPLWHLNVSIDHDLEKNESDVLMRIRRSKEAQVEMILPFLRVNNRWALNASLLQDEITDEKVLSGFTGTPTRRDNNIGLALMYDSTFRYRLSVSRSNGRNIALIAEDSDLINSDYSGQVYTVDWREFVHLTHQHVFTLRAVVGWGTDKPRTFNLGGSQTAQSLDVSAAVFQPLPLPDPFNQRQYALRGYPEGLPKLTGRRMALASLEWRFPITRIERGFMAPPVGINYLAGRLFSDHGVTSNTEKQKIYSSAGVELEFNLVLFYTLPIQTRLGYAHGFEANGGNRFYLSLGESF